METTKETTMNQQTLDLMAAIKSRNSERGLDVRCPTCGAGIQKFCLKDGVTRHMSAADITVHPARVEAARAAGFIRMAGTR